jgi:xanthine dehydrogenase molybdopterin-binding subunit B
MTRIMPTSTIGKDTVQINAREKVLGKALYSGDLKMAGMLHAAVLRSPHAHARIVRIDADAARALPGVHAVLSGEDTPTRMTGIHHKQHRILATGKVRFIGEEVVAVHCELDQLPTVASETMAIVQAQTVSGLRCVMDIARVAAGRVARAEWVGTQGQIAADWFHHRVTGVIGDSAPFEWAVQPQQTILATLRAFALAIETNSPPPISGRDGCRAVEVADACYRSAELGGTSVNVASLRE